MSTNHNFWRERTAEAVSNWGPSAYQPTATYKLIKQIRNSINIWVTKRKFHDFIDHFFPLCLLKIVYVCKMPNFKIIKELTKKHTPKIQIWRTIRPRWKFTHVFKEEPCRVYVVGEFSPIPVVAELENWRVGMVCADGSQGVNNGEKPDPLRPLNFVQNLGQPATLLDSW